MDQDHKEKLQKQFGQPEEPLLAEIAKESVVRELDAGLYPHFIELIKLDKM